MMEDMSQKELFNKIVRFNDLQESADQIMSILMSYNPFCAFVQAPMGRGKTTLVSHMLRGYGLDSKTPVVSPTYTIVNDYHIQDEWFAHMDFYRAGPGFSLAELGVLDCRPYRGMFVEWPEIPSEDESLDPTHEIEIHWVDETTRSFIVRAV